MGLTSAIVLLAVFWFMVLFVVLPIGLRTQSDEGARLIGTHASAPEISHLKRKLVWTTVIALVLWLPTCAIIMSGIITVDDFDLFSRFGPDAN